MPRSETTDRDRAKRKLTRIIDRFAQKLSHAEMELLLEQLAQEQRGLVDDETIITADDIQYATDDD